MNLEQASLEELVDLIIDNNSDVTAKIKIPDKLENPPSVFGIDIFIDDDESGMAGFDLYHKEKIIVWDCFYPLDYRNNSSEKKYGTVAHMLSLAKLYNHFKDNEDVDIEEYKVMHRTITKEKFSKDREAHLKHIGYDIKKIIFPGMLFEDYFRAPLKYAQEHNLIGKNQPK